MMKKGLFLTLIYQQPHKKAIIVLVSSTTFDLSVIKARTFDVDIRLLPRVEEIYDLIVDLDLPTMQEYDTTVYYIRNVDNLVDPFTADKEDTASFFSLYQYKQELIESSFVSSNLKVIEPLSESIGKPLGRFTSVVPVTSTTMSNSGTDDYVALDFRDIKSFDSLELVRDGFACVLLPAHNDTIPPYNVDSLIACVDTDGDIRYGIIDDYKLAANQESEAYISLYYGCFYVNVDHTYYFSFQASSVGTFEIDENLHIQQWSMNDDTAIEDTIFLTKGYHTFLIRQYASAASTNDIVRLSAKLEEIDDYVSFSMNNTATLNIQLYSFPMYAHDLLTQGASIARLPQNITDVSLGSLYLGVYRPTIVLARKHSRLLQNEFMRIFYHREPSHVEHSTIIEGSVDTLYSNTYDFGYTGHGIILDCNIQSVPSPYVSYFYDEYVNFSQFELTDTKVYDNATHNGKVCTGFSFSVVNSYYDRLSSAYLLNVIDLDKCVNVSAVRAYKQSVNYVEVLKEDIYGPTVIVLKDNIEIIEFTIRDPLIGGLEWGMLTALRVYGKASELVSIIDSKGESSIIETTEDTKLTTIKYDKVGFVPSIFEHKHIPPDVQYGSEFIMFSLDVVGELGSIDMLGNTYSVYNEEEHTVYNTDAYIHTGMLSTLDTRYFDVYKDADKSELHSFTYLCYDTTANIIKKTDYASIDIVITNIDDQDLTDYTFDITVPNTGVAYTVVDSLVASVPTAGVTSDGSLTDDPIAWNTFIVRVLLSIPQGSSETITLTPGTFSAVGTVVGSTGGEFTYLSEVLQLPLCVVRIDSIAAEARKHVCVFKEDTVPTIANAFNYTIPNFLSVSTVHVVETSGTDRTDVDVLIDVSSLTYLYPNLPICAYGGHPKQLLDTVGVNSDNTATDNFTQWDGSKIVCRMPVLPGGLATLLTLRINEFTGDPLTFAVSVDSGMTHNYHFSGSLVNDIDGVVGDNTNVLFTADKEFSYGDAVQFTYDAFATLTATTTDTDFSISFWFKTVQYGIGICSFDVEEELPAATTDIQFSTNINGNLVCSAYHTETVEVIADNKIYTDNQWHHVVLTFEAGEGISLYTDGVLQATNDIIDTRQRATSYIHLGWADSYFIGSLDEFRIYDKVLAPSEVQTLFTVFDGTLNNVIIRYNEVSSVVKPANVITSLFDLAASGGTPLYIYKYIDIDETVLRWV